MSKRSLFNNNIGQDNFPSLPFPVIPEIPLPDPPFPRGKPQIPGFGFEAPWRPPFVLRSLRQGCYLIRFTPTNRSWWNLYHYDGTMRIEKNGYDTTASGDLYYHSNFRIPWRPSPIQVEPNPANGIPVFPRVNYRYYLRITQILEAFTLSKSFTLKFERWRHSPPGNSWTNEGVFSAKMTWTTAPAGYPSPGNYLEGDVKDSGGNLIGSLTMGWVSEYYRKATLEIDRVAQSESPQDNGSGTDWRDVFDDVGWDLNVVNSDNNISEPSGESWSNAEMHSAMLSQRDAADLDKEWRYHLLCVRGLDYTSRGVMYDAGGTDSNNIPREGAGIASHWEIPDTSKWGTVAGTRFGAADAPYFRTAVHEIGHAMGLIHNTVDNGFMNTTGTIAESPGTFPANVRWSFAPDDINRLRHLPDPWVRPGMIPFQRYGAVPLSTDDESIVNLDGVHFEVSTLMPIVPIGAPVRIELKLTNNLETEIPAPESLSLKSEHISGYVENTSGARRSFRSIFKCLDDEHTSVLKSGESLQYAMTLLRGREGALFPEAGSYKVVVNAQWEIDHIPVMVTGTTEIMISQAIDENHARAAMEVLTTPDTLLSLAIGGDHLTEGNSAINTAMNNPVLRAHFGVIQAKRFAQKFQGRSPRLDESCASLVDTPVMSSVEVGKAAEMMEKVKKDQTLYNDGATKIVKMLKDRAKDANVSKETRSRIKKL